MGRKFRVGISGSYGGLNLGDEAILQCMVGELRKSVDVEITVFSRNPEDTRARHTGVDRAIPVRSVTRTEVLEEIKRLDLFVLGGGGILYDEGARKYLREVEVAHEVGVPVMLHAVGAGPLKDPNAQALVREMLNNVALLTVRERSAHKILEDAGVTREIIHTADPALLLSPEPLPEGSLEVEGMREGKRVIGMSVREPGAAAPDLDEQVYHALLANAADFMVDRYDAQIALVPMESNVKDVQHSHAVISQMLNARRATVVRGDYTSGQILSLVGRFEFAVGMRLHFLIFAALQGVPFVALPYASKVSGLVESLGLQMPPLKNVNAGRVIAHIDGSWDRRHGLKKSLEGRIEELREKARETNRLLVRLITEIATKKNMLEEIRVATASPTRT